MCIAPIAAGGLTQGSLIEGSAPRAARVAAAALTPPARRERLAIVASTMVAACNVLFPRNLQKTSTQTVGERGNNLGTEPPEYPLKPTDHY